MRKKRIWTNQQLEALPKDGYKYELLDGELIKSPGFAKHGVRLVWRVDWTKEQVHIYTPDSISALTRPTDVLSGGDVLPDFKCRLSRIF